MIDAPHRLGRALLREVLDGRPLPPCPPDTFAALATLIDAGRLSAAEAAEIILTEQNLDRALDARTARERAVNETVARVFEREAAVVEQWAADVKAREKKRQYLVGQVLRESGGDGATVGRIIDERLTAWLPIS